jgi:SPP1 family predicted phage head-tail adaptor
VNKQVLASSARYRVTIQYKTSTTDGDAGFVDTWEDGITVWADVTPIKARQQFENKSVNVDATHTIVVRGNITPTPRESDRIKWTRASTIRYFEILTIENLQERNIRLVITCKERR